MKKLLTVAGLAGLIVCGAFAQGGTRTQSGPVFVSVDTYMNLSPITSVTPGPSVNPPIFSFHVTDGGFNGPYADGSGGRFTATSNVIYKLDASVSINKGYQVWCNLDGTGFAATAEVTGQPVTPGAPHAVTGQLQGNATLGLPPDAGTTGTLTVTISAA